MTNKSTVAIATTALPGRAVRIVAILAVILVAPLSVSGEQKAAPERSTFAAPLPSLSALINADRERVQLYDLSGAQRDAAIKRTLASKDFRLLREQFAKEKFELDPAATTVTEAHYLGSALRITIVSVPGRGTTDDTTANVTVVTASDGTSLAVGHITNVGTTFEVHQTGYPVFYVRWWIPKHGRLIYWRYWWYDSHNHPNWFYSSYYWYYRYWWYYRNPWPYWYNWFWGWYYGYHWHYWSTWFPW